MSYTPEDIEADEEPIPEAVNEPESGVEAALASLERGSRHTTSLPQSLEANREPDPARKDRIRRSVSLSLPIISGMCVIDIMKKFRKPVNAFQMS